MKQHQVLKTVKMHFKSENYSIDLENLDYLEKEIEESNLKKVENALEQFRKDLEDPTKHDLAEIINLDEGTSKMYKNGIESIIMERIKIEKDMMKLVASE